MRPTNSASDIRASRCQRDPQSTGQLRQDNHTRVVLAVMCTSKDAESCSHDRGSVHPRMGPPRL